MFSSVIKPFFAGVPSPVLNGALTSMSSPLISSQPADVYQPSVGLQHRTAWSPKVYTERIDCFPQSYVSPDVIAWMKTVKDVQIPKEAYKPKDTLVHEVTSPRGSAVKLRMYQAPAAPVTSGPVVLFLPGLGDVPYGSDPYLENGLKSPFPVFSLDRTYPKNGRYEMNVANELEDMETAVKYLHDMTGQKVHVVSFSLGGLFAPQVAMKNSNDIASLALVGATVPTEKTDSLFSEVLAVPDDKAQTLKNVAEMKKLTRGLPTALDNLRVPTVFYMSQFELDKLNEDGPEAFDLLRRNLGKGIEDIRIFKGPAETHVFSQQRLDALQQWWASR